MNYSKEYCPDCGCPDPLFPCMVCEEIAGYFTQPDPTDEELGAMAAYYDQIEEQGRIDAYDDMDHDHVE